MADGWPKNIIGESLTQRESEVAGLVSQGLANKVVAGLLGVREGTVKIHLHNIYRKLRVANRTGLVLSVIANRG
jgi:DNA-binding NarL/FixJ family response regulator